METEVSFIVEYSPRSSVIMGAHMSNASEGTGNVLWGVIVPGWHNDVRYYRDVLAYPAIQVWRVETCATCHGIGSVPFARDANKPAWARRMKRCSAHAPTRRTPESVYRVPRFEDLIAAAS